MCWWSRTACLGWKWAWFHKDQQRSPRVPLCEGEYWVLDRLSIWKNVKTRRQIKHIFLICLWGKLYTINCIGLLYWCKSYNRVRTFSPESSRGMHDSPISDIWLDSGKEKEDLPLTNTICRGSKANQSNFISPKSE